MVLGNGKGSEKWKVTVCGSKTRECLKERTREQRERNLADVVVFEDVKPYQTYTSFT